MGGFPAYNYTSFDLSPGQGSAPLSSMWGQPAAPLDASSFNFGASTPSPLMEGMTSLSDPGNLSPLSSGAPVDISGAASGMPGIGGIGGAHTGGLFGMTGPQTIGAGIEGLKGLGQLWMGLKQLSLAKKQFAFQRDFANTNLANSMKTYNTALADRARARGFTEGDSTGAVQDYVNQNSLSKAGGPAAVNPVMALPSAQAGNTASVTNPVSNNTTRNPNGY